MGSGRRFGRRRILALAGGTLGLTIMGGTGVASASFYLGKNDADRLWEATKYTKMVGVGEVHRLSVLPLVEWFTAGENLVGEAGLSYLVQADDTSLLLDVGGNWRQEHPSPFLRNVEALGVDLNKLDALVISHPHNDHIGGVAGRVSPSTQPFDFRGIPAYVTSEIDCPTARMVKSPDPRVLAPGVATTGVIYRQDFVSGSIPEHALAVNVAGKGIVLIVGCGHPTVKRLVERAETLFDSPVYGIIGGLHFPVTGSRAVVGGLPAQKIIGTGKWPTDPIDERDVEEAISFLKTRNLRLVALSAHDSCDWTLEAFHNAFGGAYCEVAVGKPIEVA